MTAERQAALEYARRGWKVLPCANGVPAVGKGGFKNASSDENVVEAWWRDRPTAQIGIAARPSGLLVIDVDPRNGGDDTLARLEAEYGALPRACHVRSGGGGQHFYFEDPGARLRGKLPGGVDVKCNGFVVAPPSRHRSGRRYAWISEAEPPPMPSRWVQLLTKTDDLDGAGIEAWRESARGKLDATALRKRLGELPKRGQGKDATYQATCTIFYDYGCSVDEGWPFFVEWNRTCGKPVDDCELWRQMEQIASKKPAKGRGLVRTGVRVEQKPAVASSDVVCLADVEPETVRWLWAARIPFGKLTVVDGDPGLGKSTMTLDVAARLTRGERMPFDDSPPHPPADVVLMSAEDGPADTIRPRADAANADVKRVHLWVAVRDEEGHEDTPTIGDVEELERIIRERKVLLVVVDPFVAYLPDDKNSHNDHDMRRAMAPLAKLADDTGAAIVLVRHLKKSGEGAIYRGGGSIGIAGAARSVLLVAKKINRDEETGEETETRVLAPVKSNLAREAPPLEYRVVDAGGVGKIEWIGVAEGVSADDLVAAKKQEKKATKTDECVEWLRDFLSDGPQDHEAVERAAEAHAFSEKVLRVARERLAVRTVRHKKGRTLWRLPGEGDRTVSVDFRAAPSRRAP